MAKRFRFFLISDFPFLSILPLRSPHSLPLSYILPYRHFLSFLLCGRDLLCHFFFRVGVGRVGWMDGYLLPSFHGAAKRREALRRSIGLLSGYGRSTILRELYGSLRPNSLRKKAGLQQSANRTEITRWTYCVCFRFFFSFPTFFSPPTCTG